MTPLQEVILKAVRSANGAWLSRKDISKRIKRPARLNPHDVEMLEGLVRDGYIEVGMRLIGTVQKERIYRNAPAQRVAGDVVPIPYAPEDEE